MDIRFLESFLVVVESGSVAEAARRLDLTPAALAQRIRGLESELGARLLTRAGRTTQPTEAGRTILEAARHLVLGARDLRALATADTLAGQLRLGAVSTAVTGILPSILSLLATSCPQLDTYIEPGTSADLYQKVLGGDLDAAILVYPPFGLRKTCDWMLLRKEPLVLLSPASVPITNPRSLLATEPFIRYDRKHWGGRLAEAYMKHAKLFPRVRFELDALDAIAVMVGRGLGISLVPDWAPPWPEGLALNKVPLEAPAYSRRIGLLWIRNCAKIRLVRTFRIQARLALGVAAP